MGLLPPPGIPRHIVWAVVSSSFVGGACLGVGLILGPIMGGCG